MNDLFGTSQGTIQTQGSNNPWSGVQPYLQDLFSRGQSQSNAGQSPFTTQAQQMVSQRATDPNSLVSRAQGVVGNTIGGQYLNPSSNPYLSASVNDALGLAKSQFAGQYGGQAGGNLSNSGYQEGLARTLGNVATNAYANNYNQERQNQLIASQLAPSLDYANINPLSAIGIQQQAFPWQQLQGYQSAISGGLGPFGQQTGQQPYFQNNTANTLGALALGAGAFFSDRRLKSNIVKVGDHPKGFGIYEYDIFDRRERGVMADEVEKIMPEIVSERHGFKMVDYSRIQ